MKAASEYAVFAAHKNLAQISLFSHRFTELEGKRGEAIAVPVYDLSAGGEFNSSTNNYGTGVNETGGLLVHLNRHYCKSVSITDKDIAYTGINWVKDTAAALAERCTRDVNKAVFECLSGATLTAATSAYFGATPQMADIAGLYALAETNDIPVDRCVVALTPTYMAKVLGSDLVKYCVIGDGEYVKTGIIKNVIGFKGFVCSSNLPEGCNGAVILDEAVGVASKYLAPLQPNAYPEAWRATSDEGFTVGFRRFTDLPTGSDKFAIEALYGATLLQPSKVIKLI